jgi:hypothetical protein
MVENRDLLCTLPGSEAHLAGSSFFNEIKKEKGKFKNKKFKKKFKKKIF